MPLTPLAVSATQTLIGDVSRRKPSKEENERWRMTGSRDSSTATCIMFGTDLPSTRAWRPFADADVSLVPAALGEEMGRRVLYDNAVAFYRPSLADSQPEQ